MSENKLYTADQQQQEDILDQESHLYTTITHIILYIPCLHYVHCASWKTIMLS